jgi:hypothetical protein
MSSDLVRQCTQQVERVRMLGLHGEDLSVKRLGIRQPASLMVLEREFEGLLDREGGHGGIGNANNTPGEAGTQLHRGPGVSACD